MEPEKTEVRVHKNSTGSKHLQLSILAQGTAPRGEPRGEPGFLLRWPQAMHTPQMRHDTFLAPRAALSLKPLGLRVPEVSA